MTSILILEDQYTKNIYAWLHKQFPDYKFPITDTIRDPMAYKDLFTKVDVILLDNYFPGKNGWWEEPLGCEVLDYLMTQNITKKVVCISDYKNSLLAKYDSREKAYKVWMIYGFPSKDVNDISSVISRIVIENEATLSDNIKVLELILKK